MPPAQALINTDDNPDLAAEFSQRVAAASQTVQGVLSTWALHRQREEGRAASGHRGGLSGANGDDRRDETDRRQAEASGSATARKSREEIAADPVVATVRPLIVADAGLDACGADSTLTQTEQARVRRRFTIVPDSGEVASRAEALLASDEAAQSGVLLAAADDNPASIPLLGGTNPLAARSVRVPEASGVASALVAEEAVDAEDPLGPVRGLGDGVEGRDPLSVHAWETDPIRGEEHLSRRR